MRRVLFTLVTGTAVLAAACSERAPLLPVQSAPHPSGPVGQLSCTVDVARRAMQCGAPSAAPGVSGNLILGGQGLNVTLASSGTAYDSGTQQLTSSVTVQNLIVQPLATADGTTPDTSGVRVFFAQGPTVTAGSGSVSVVPDGVGNFLSSGEAYYQYAGKALGADGILSQGETSAPRTWTFSVDPTVTTFSFIVYVWTTVPKPDGWVVVVPATDSLVAGGSRLYVDTVYTPTGRVRPTDHGWWSSSDTTVARVDSVSGNVVAVAAGTATITSHFRTATGTATVHVYAAAAQFAAVSAGESHTCALDPAGAAYCWGNNTSGQLGLGTVDTAVSTATAVPAAVTGGHVFTQVAAGNQATCGLDSGGVAWCWGSNAFGLLGVSSTPQTCSVEFPEPCSPTPLQVSTTLHFTTLASSPLEGHICGIATTGDTWCWGTNAFGVLGNGDTASAASLPVKVIGGHHFTQIAVGSDHRSCGLESGTVYCWGNHFAAATGGTPVVCVRQGFYTCDLAPEPIGGGITFQSMAMMGRDACGLDSAGVTYCWLGFGVSDPSTHPVPQAVDTPERFAHLYAGGLTICGLTADGQAFCWGSNFSNNYGQIGDGTTTDRYVPTAVAGGYRFLSLATGHSTTCGVTSHTVFCWGSGSTGEIGNGTLTSTNPLPLQVNDHP